MNNFDKHDLPAFLQGSLDEKKNEYFRLELRKYGVRNKMMKEEKMMNRQSKHDSLVHIEDEKLAAFSRSYLEGGETERVQSHVKTCPDCMDKLIEIEKNFVELDSMQLQPTPEFLLAQGKNLQPGLPKGVNSVKDYLNSLIGRIKSRFAPPKVWRLAPLVVAAVALVLLLLNLPTSPVKNISMGDRLVITEMGPLGFVGEKEVRDYKGMNVSLSEDGKNLIFSWPEIEGAEYYEIFLIGEDGKEMRITPIEGVQDTSFEYEKEGVEVGKEFVWELRGKMGGDRSFEGKSKFLLTIIFN